MWGQLRLVSPDVPLSQFIEQQTKADPVYPPQHVYQAVVIGEGAS